MEFEYENFLYIVSKELGYCDNYLHMNGKLIDLGVDSLNLINLIISLENSFNIKVPLCNISNSMTLAELFNTIINYNYGENSGTTEKFPLYAKRNIQSINELFKMMNELYLKRIAFEYRNQDDTLTKKSYDDFLADVINYIRDSDLLTRERRKIAIIGENSYEWVVIFFSIIFSNNIPVLIMPNLDKISIMDILIYSSCDVIYYDKLNNVLSEVIESITIKLSIQSYFIELKGIVRETPQEESNIKNDRAIFYKNVQADQTAIIIYTSGTTGKYKGVSLSHTNIMSNVIAISQMVCYPERTMLVLPLCHSYGLVMGLMVPLVFGSSIYISKGFDSILKELQQVKPQLLAVVPIVFNILNLELENKLAKASSLQLEVNKNDRGYTSVNLADLNILGGDLQNIIIGGAPSNPQALYKFEEYGIKVLSGYGITECSPVVSINRIFDSRNDSVGNVLPCCKVTIKNPDSNGIGEIEVKGSNVMSGYVNNDNETCEVLNNGWFSTGDYGYIHNGHLYIRGRKKNMILLDNGENIFPEEIEKRIKTINNVKEALVYCEDKSIVTEVYLDQTDEMTKERFIIDLDYVNLNLPIFKRVRKVKFRNKAFQKTSTGKVIRKGGS